MGEGEVRPGMAGVDARAILAQIGVQTPSAGMVLALRRAIAEAQRLHGLPGAAARRQALAPGQYVQFTLTDGKPWEMEADEHIVEDLVSSGLDIFRLTGVAPAVSQNFREVAAFMLNHFLRVAYLMFCLRMIGLDPTARCAAMRREMDRIRQGVKLKLTIRRYVDVRDWPAQWVDIEGGVARETGS